MKSCVDIVYGGLNFKDAPYFLTAKGAIDFIKFNHKVLNVCKYNYWKMSDKELKKLAVWKKKNVCDKKTASYKFMKAKKEEAIAKYD